MPSLKAIFIAKKVKREESIRLENMTIRYVIIVLLTMYGKSVIIKVIF
ncbi:MAG: hypothetical protein AAB906_01195 [Patescibacteria group bacterium]